MMSNDLVPHQQSSPLSTFLEKLNLPEVVAGPAGKAISRLIAGVLEIPATYLDSFTQGIRDKTEAKQLVSREVATAAAKLAASDSSIIARAAHNLLAKEYRHQKNKEDIAKRTINILEKEQSEADATRSVSAGAHKQQADVDEDWLNVFEKYAEDASTERMQHLWARVLAGEIRKPKTFSLKTLRFVAELDQEIAHLCEKHFPLICGAAIPTLVHLTGSDLAELVQLQDVGLLAGVGGLFNQTVDLSAAGQAIIPNQGRLLMISGNPNQKLQFPVAMVTKIGREIASIIHVPFSIESSREIANRLPKSGLKSIALLTPTPSPGSAKLEMQEMLWTEPSVQQS
jgi:hypothetical protein